MAIYIKSGESITSQNTFNSENLFLDIIPIEGEYYKFHSPDFKQFLDVKLLRRMTNILKVGVVTAKLCLEKSNLENPDAILVGTGMGCIEDTTKFLKQIIDNDEELLNPTPFIQSTHNTISGQIALILKCKNYNLTFTQNTISFDTALLDAHMFLNDNEKQNVLVGGIDEIIEEAFDLIRINGCLKSDDKNSIPKLGEGCAFFVLSNTKNDNCKVELKDISILNITNNFDELKTHVSDFLFKNNLVFEDINFIISGQNDNAKQDSYYQEFNSLFTESTILKYKHLIGEFDTASSIGMFLAYKIILKETIPAPLIFIDRHVSKLKTGIVFNYSKNKDFSLLLLSECENSI